MGGLGTVFGPLLGAFILHALGEIAKSFAGQILGLDLALYGVLLILVVAFARDGIAGLLKRLFHGLRARRRPDEEAGMSSTEQLLSVASASKRYGGLLAVDEASLAVSRGSITGLIGPNGAGKTTLFNLVSGAQPVSGGAIHFEGEDITRLPAHRRATLGIGRTFQIVQPFAGLSVRENIAVGAYLRLPSRAAAMAHAESVAELAGLAVKLDAPASSLTVSARKRLELARALATGPKLLLLDEILAGLNPSEIRDIIPVIRGIRESGVTILMVEHVMQAVMSLCEHIFVLARGRIIAAGDPRSTTANPAVIEAYLGKKASARINAMHDEASSEASAVHG